MKQVYLDGAANAPVDKSVFAAMQKYLTNGFVGNSFSVHDFGVQANLAIEKARDQVASALKIAPEEVYFTSGASESNNWVIRSLALHQLELPVDQRKMTILVSALEHSSVTEPCKSLIPLGFNIVYVHSDSKGHILPSEVEKLMSDQVLLVCIMAVNNELGTWNDINNIGAVVHKYNSYLLCDITQGLCYGSQYLNLNTGPYAGADYYSFSGHKIYGPLGVGGLIRSYDVPLYSYIFGGPQENGLRAGTCNTPGIVGLGEAFNVLSDLSLDTHYNKLYEYLLEQLAKLPEPLNLIKPTVTPDQKNIVNLNFSAAIKDPQLSARFANHDIACSAGSACNAQEGSCMVASPVLLDIGIPVSEAGNCVRLSFTKYTTVDDINAFIKATKDIYQEGGLQDNE